MNSGIKEDLLAPKALNVYMPIVSNLESRVLQTQNIFQGQSQAQQNLMGVHSVNLTSIDEVNIESGHAKLIDPDVHLPNVNNVENLDQGLKDDQD